MAVVTQAPLQIDKGIRAAAVSRHPPLRRCVTRPVRLLLVQARIKSDIRLWACSVAVCSLGQRLGHTPQPELTIKFDRGASLRLVHPEVGNEQCTSLTSSQGGHHTCVDRPESMSVTSGNVEPASLSDTASPFGESNSLRMSQLLCMYARPAFSVLATLCPASK